MNSPHTYTTSRTKCLLPQLIYQRHVQSPKLFTFNNSMCVHWTRKFRFTKPWHIKPPYITLFNKKKLPLRLCNTQNKCVHIYSISVTWWQQVIGFDIADGSISMMSHLLNYTWERCFFTLIMGNICDRLVAIYFTLQLSNCYLIHETEVLNFVWTIKFLSFHLFMEGEGELGVSSLKKINQNFEFDLSHLV